MTAMIVRKISFATLLSLLVLSLSLAFGSSADRTDMNDTSGLEIETVLSNVDYNANGVDDYTDFLLGARADAENFPTYDDRYFEGGYPPDDIGVCADVVWRAFKAAGYSLKDMIDRDIAENLIHYSSIVKPDPNIDFRRVVNLKVFFSRYAVRLTNDIDDVAEWQPGDIVIFGQNNRHIGIVSDIRNEQGRTYIIHNSGQPEREEDYLGQDEVTAHFRFDASRLPDEVLIPWVDIPTAVG